MRDGFVSTALTEEFDRLEELLEDAYDAQDWIEAPIDPGGNVDSCFIDLEFKIRSLRQQLRALDREMCTERLRFEELGVRYRPERWPAPKVLRHKLKRNSKAVLDRVKQFGGRCAYCGGPFEHLDHLVPISRGGTHAIENLFPACSPCNLEKSGMMPFDWFMKKYGTPTWPEWVEAYRKSWHLIQEMCR
jgi:5-methylcytosine-specific restriction endonuclease McrA